VSTLAPQTSRPRFAVFTCAPSPHLLTNFAINEAFLGEKITATDLENGNARLRIR
jgi:hypothetical protein